MELLPSSHKVDDFQLGFRGQFGGRPVGPADDLAVQLDGHPLGIDFECAQQVGDSTAWGNLAGFSVDDDPDRV